MKHLKYFLLLFVCCFSVNVFAATYGQSSDDTFVQFSLSNGNVINSFDNPIDLHFEADNVKYIILNIPTDNIAGNNYSVFYDFQIWYLGSTAPNLTISYLIQRSQNLTFTPHLEVTSNVAENHQGAAGRLVRYHLTCDYTSLSNNGNLYMTITLSAAKFIDFYSLWNHQIYYHGDSSTTEIIANDNRNTQKIIDSQNRTTAAIENNTQVQEDINDTLNDDDVDNPSSSFDDMADLLPDNGVITDLIGLPITLLTKINTSVSGSCSSFSLGTLFDTEIELPCIDISDYIGSSLWSVIDVLFSGFFVIVISKKMISVFNNFSSMKEGDVLGD